MIRPEEAAMLNDENDVQILADAEKLIDAALKKSYHTGTSVTFNDDNIPLRKNRRLQAILLDRYQKAGWKVTSGSDQRDCTSWLTFAASEKKPSPAPGSLR